MSWRRNPPSDYGLWMGKRPNQVSASKKPSVGRQIDLEPSQGYALTYALDCGRVVFSRAYLFQVGDIWYHWKDSLATVRVLVSDFNASVHILERRKERKNKLLKIEQMRESGATDDAIKNEEANMNGGGWDDRHPNYNGIVGEDRLKVDIRDLCDELIEQTGGEPNVSLMFHMVEAHIAM